MRLRIARKLVYKCHMRAAIVSVLLMLCSSAASCDKRAEEPTGRVPSPANTPAGSESQSGARPTTPDRLPFPSAGPRLCMVPMAPGPGPKPQVASRCPLDPVFGGVHLPTEKITFPEAPDAPTLKVELAGRAEEQQRGLMYRTQMPEMEGMLFALGPPEVHTFWMRNTCIPLDMMFVTSDGFITGIVENVPTLNDDERSIPCPVSYVLEVNAGWSRKHGVKPGQKVILPGR